MKTLKRLSSPWPVALFLLALLPRLFDLGQFLTSDENTNIFFAGSAVVQAFLRGDWAGTYWHFYPGVTMSWADALGMVAQWLGERLTGATTLPLADFVAGDIRHLLVATRLPYAALTATFVPAVYHLLRRWLSPAGEGSVPARAWALAAALVIAVDPFFLAHSRVVHADAPVAVFMTLSTLAWFLYLRDGGRRMLAFSAAMGSLAALTKAPGQFMAPFVIVTAAGDWALASWRAGRPNWPRFRRRLLAVTVWGAAALVVFVALWPAMWSDPLGTLGRMLSETFGKVDEGHLVYFMGRPTTDPGLWFYLVVIPFRITPLTGLGATLSLGMVFVPLWRKKAPANDSPLFPTLYSLLLLLWFYTLTLFLFGDFSPKKQDRYLLPLFPVLDILAVMGWFGLWQFFTFYVLRFTHYAPRVTYSVLALLLIITQAAIALPWHPYYLAYFNPLLGGLSRAVETTLVGWGEGLEQAAAYLNRKPDAESLTVAVTPSQTFLPYFKGRGENFYTNDVALRADYVIIYRAQQQRLAPSPEIVREYMRRRPEKVITIKGVPYAWIFRNDPLIFRDVPPGAALTNTGFGEVMRLAGYRLEAAGDALTVDLFWHALPPIEAATGPCREERVENFTATVCPRLNYAVSVRVVAPDGSIIARHDGWPAGGLLPTSQWRVGDYVQDRHTLPLPPDAPPGNYTLSVVVYDSDFASE
ncbi:MAG: ArnT family glycosyltransferase, partial [Anaerolineae bacterium]